MIHRKTRRSWDREGDAHALTFSTKGRRPWLSLDGAAYEFLLCLHEVRQAEGFLLYSYVVMPEHVHLVIHPGPGGQLIRDTLGPLKVSSAKSIFRLHPHLREQALVYRKGTVIGHSFWEAGGGYDRNLRSAEEILEKIQYTHLNPLRRGLVGEGEHYPWSSLGAYEGRETPIPVDLFDPR